MDLLHKLVQTKISRNVEIADAVHELVDENKCVLEVPYEDYLYDRESTLSDIQSFLGLRFEKTKSERYKVTSDNLCEMLENWDEICRNFYSCPIWQHMMDDEQNNCYCPLDPGPSKFCALERNARYAYLIRDNRR